MHIAQSVRTQDQIGIWHRLSRCQTEFEACDISICVTSDASSSLAAYTRRVVSDTVKPPPGDGFVWHAEGSVHGVCKRLQITGLQGRDGGVPPQRR